MADKVSKLDKDGVINYYSTYNAAKNASGNNPGDHDLIQIWADLTEQIVLKNGVDICIMPGVVIKSGSSLTTIIAPTSGDLNCNIYGQGIIKNDTNGNCILIDNQAAKLKIDCDNIEGTGGYGSSISVNIKKANKFHLTCNKVYNRDWQAIRFGELLVPGLIEDINLNISKVETGNITTSSPYTGTTAITTRGNGFIKIDEILCRNLGHCLSHREGKLTARIIKMKTLTNYIYFGSSGSTLHIAQYDGSNPGTGTQKLILYFDEIQALGSLSVDSNNAIEVSEGAGIFIGRKVFSSNSYALIIGGNDTKGYVRFDEIISEHFIALAISNNNNEITIDANYIEGNYSDVGIASVVYSSGSSSNPGNFLIKNAKIRNKNSSSTATGIFLENIYPKVTLNNVKIIAGAADGNIIYLSNGTSIDVKNYGLFGNYNINETKIKLKIGTSLTDLNYNYQCIIDPLLS